MEKKIDKLITLVYTWGFLYISNMDLLPLWLRLATAIGALVGCIVLVAWEVTDFVGAWKEKKGKIK